MSRSAALSLPLSCSGRKRGKRTVRRIRIFLTISSGVIISYSGKFCNADLQGFMKICRQSVDGFFAINHIRRGSASLVSCKHPRLPNFCSNRETVNIFWIDHIMEKYIYNEQNGLRHELRGDYYISCLNSPPKKRQGISAHGTAAFAVSLQCFLVYRSKLIAHGRYTDAAGGGYDKFCRMSLQRFQLQHTRFIYAPYILRS